VRPCAREADQVGAEPTPHLEHPLATAALEVGEARYERLESVSLRLDLLEELRASDRGVRELRSARIAVPETTHIALQLVVDDSGHGVRFIS